VSKKVAAVTMAFPAPELVFGHPFSKEWPLALDVAQSWQLHPHSVRVCGKSDEKQATI
jgi:hypothetical protein